MGKGLDHHDSEVRKRARFNAKHPEIVAKYKARQMHAFHLKYTHGMTRGDYEALLRVQKGRCAICSKTPKELGVAHLSVDHCHETGRVRGLLCSPCNLRLGVAREDASLAARHLADIREALTVYIVTRCVPSKAAGVL